MQPAPAYWHRQPHQLGTIAITFGEAECSPQALHSSGLIAGQRRVLDSFTHLTIPINLGRESLPHLTPNFNCIPLKTGAGMGLINVLGARMAWSVACLG